MTTVAPLAALDTTAPVLLLGGEANAVECARHLSSLGITVHVSGGPGCWALHSRHVARAFAIPENAETHQSWAELLFGSDRSLDGAVVFALNDDAIAFVLEHEDALRARYRLEAFDGNLRRAMLDKRETLELARKTGVPHPRFWPVEGIEDVAALKGQIDGPVIVKPIHSHAFVRVFRKKLFVVEDGFDSLMRQARLALEAALDIQIVEMIPGPDSQLSSYYTYIDENGRPLFHYTKRIIRRYPMNSGPAVYHATEWLPETAEMGLKYLQGIGWRGFANIEFKRDPRDGELKIIEVNTRFTAAHRLLIKSGAPVDLVAYCAATGQEAPVIKGYRENLLLWVPERDVRAFWELRSLGKLGWRGWFKSLPLRGFVLPMGHLSDPGPGLARIAMSLRGLLERAKAAHG